MKKTRKKSKKNNSRILLYACVVCLLLFSIIYILISKNNDANIEIIKESETQNKLSEEYKKVVYLTFDDGPSNNVGRLLDLLDKYDAKATFFMVGYSVEERPHLAKLVYERGHSIGMHSYSHSEKIYESLKDFKDDLNKSEKVFKEALGFVPKLYRFPFGSHNKYLNSENYKLVTKELKKRGYVFYDWDVSSHDGSKDVVGYEIYVNAVNGMEENEAPIILMHETNKNTMDVIEFILQYGFMKGYKFDSLIKEERYE